MKLPNGYGSISKSKKKVRKKYNVRAPEVLIYDKKENRVRVSRPSLGYYETYGEALAALEEYNSKKEFYKNQNITFAELYERWSSGKFQYVGQRSVETYEYAFKLSAPLHKKKISKIHLSDLQNVVDSCGKNYPTLKILKVLYKQMFEFAYMHDIVDKNFAVWVDILRYKKRNPNKMKRERFSKEKVAEAWEKVENKGDMTVLMLLYTGVRVGELLNLKKEHVHIDENYFEVVQSKTENGIREVPICDKIMPFFKEWYYDESNRSEYLIFDHRGQHIKYMEYRYIYYNPFIEKLDIDLTPHCCRHTFISMMAEKNISQTIIKKIVGHSGAMTLAERVYTHFNVQELLDAANQL